MRRKKERILIYVVMAIMEAIGGIAFFCAIMGVELEQLGGIASLGMIGGLSGLLLGIFLILDIRHENY